MTERKDRGGRPIRPGWRPLIAEMVDSLPLPAAFISNFERGQWTVRSNAVPISLVGGLVADDGSTGLGEILNRRDQLPLQFDAAMAEVLTSGNPYQDRV